MAILNSKKALKSLNPVKIILPVCISLGVILYLFLVQDEFDLKKIIIHLGEAEIKWIGLALIILVIRDLSYMYRIHHITEKKLSWLSSFYVVFLWEFASAVTPSVVGGTAVAIFILNREKIEMGKSMAYIILTAIFDNMFFVLVSLLIVFLIPFQIFPPEQNIFSLFGIQMTLYNIFLVSISLIFLYTSLMFYGLFIHPNGFKWLLVKLSSNLFLRKWKKAAYRNGDDIIAASRVFRHKPIHYWLRITFSTLLVWISRYFMLNCIISSFTKISLLDHLLILCRQVIMWIVMLISPTPGSTGTAEFAFNLFFKDFFSIVGMSLVVALFWRLFTYYAYLFIGIFILPRWWRRIIK